MNAKLKMMVATSLSLSTCAPKWLWGTGGPPPEIFIATASHPLMACSTPRGFSTALGQNPSASEDGSVNLGSLDRLRAPLRITYDLSLCKHLGNKNRIPFSYHHYHPPPTTVGSLAFNTLETVYL
ncbi:hypothetical protein LY78DRAFT_118250 [Colletotrichum sublineola]|nr:hypothetical protein LY78DRAFT_118250 [Colletotrichum sublineola]